MAEHASKELLPDDVQNGITMSIHHFDEQGFIVDATCVLMILCHTNLKTQTVMTHNYQSYVQVQLFLC